MAGSKDKHTKSAAALEALAEGDCPSDTSNSAAEDNFAGCEDTSLSPLQRRAHHEMVQKSMAHAHALSLKKTLIPLLLTVGVLLLVLSAATIAMLLSSSTSTEPLESSMLRKYGPTLILISCPLAAVLLGGAWLFYVEIRRTKS